MKNVMLCSVLCAAFVVATGAALVGCGSSNSPNTNTNTSTSTNTNTNTAAQTFVASCTYVNALGASTITICTDYTTGSGLGASDVQANCSGSGETYSSGHCSTTNLIGTCTLPVTGTVVYHYSGGLDTASADQSSCTGSGGTWANP
jgi:hypothetical protein